MPVDDVSRVFFERTGTYRKATYGLIVLVFGTAGLFVLITGLWHLATEGFQDGQPLGVIFTSIW
ncbi:MAG TPA: hypothetical protein VGG30_09720, partial [Pirellulales bacterium]